MDRATRNDTDRRRSSRVQEGARLPWMQLGIPAGCLGAAVVAAFFLGVDLLEGRPFWTPTALGARFFQGEALSPDAAASAPLVFAYTLLHVAAFVGFASAAAVALLSVRRLPSSALALGGALALAFFAASEAAFLGLVTIFAPALVGELGTGRIAAGNALAALAMAGWLAWRAPVRRRAADGARASRASGGRDQPGAARSGAELAGR